VSNPLHHPAGQPGSQLIWAAQAPPRAPEPPAREPLAAGDDLELDLDLSDRRLRPGGFTLALLSGIVLVLAFGAGVLVQKHDGATGSAAQSAGLGGSAPAAGSGFPGGSGAPGGYGAAGAGSGSAGSPGAQGTASGQSAAPVVVGTVTAISGTRLTVKNFAGTSVTVKVPAGAAITLVAGARLTALAPGVSVSVTGTKASDGTVTASTVTVRS
jgi:hypothetical protein